VRRNLSIHQPLDAILQSRPVGIHASLLDRADVVDVDINREPIEIGMEYVERRAAFQSDSRSDQCVSAKASRMSTSRITRSSVAG
jgi:hypothetical protein